MIAEMDFHTAKALLDWQVELGATEAIGDVPINRYELPKAPAKTKVAEQTAAQSAVPDVESPFVAQKVDAEAEARALAEAAQDLASLKAAMAAFTHCDLCKGARSLVFGDGNPAARVMIIGKPPGRDEDRAGRPFVGAAGVLFDRMFAAIDMARDATSSPMALYLTNVVPWRPTQDREPNAAELAMLRPFLQRHVEIVAPDILILMGRSPCQAVLGRGGVSRIRGTWDKAFGRPALPMLHPDHLIQNPLAKREAWQDLLLLKARLTGAE